LNTATAWAVDPVVLPGFLLTMALIELTPGPNMAYLAVIAVIAVIAAVADGRPAR
jgi:hypothetical protein